MSNSQDQRVKVFISYSHDSEIHRRKVLNLANRLRNEGIDAQLDQYLEHAPPAEGWSAWMVDEVEAATFVLVICTPKYYQRFRRKGAPTAGRGVAWEGAIIYQTIYDSFTRNTKFVPIGFKPQHDLREHTPMPLRATNFYNVSNDDEYKKLYRHLTGQPENPAPPLGLLVSMPSGGATSPASPSGAVSDHGGQAEAAAPTSPASTGGGPAGDPAPPPPEPDGLPARAMPYDDLWIELVEGVSLQWVALDGPEIATVPGAARPKPVDLRDLVEGPGPTGSQLCERLFAGAWATYLEHLRALCARQGRGLRVGVSVVSDTAAALPWEALFDSSGEPGPTHPPRWVVVRSPPGRAFAESALGPPEAPVRILVAATDAGEEEATIRHCLRAPMQDGRADIDVAPAGSWGAFQHHARAASPQWLHLALQGDARGVFFAAQAPAPIGWAELQAFLGTLAELRVVVLNLLPAPGAPQGGRALVRLRAERPLWAVVATRAPVDLAAAHWYSRLLYTALSAGHSLAFAVGLGRFGVAHCGVDTIAQTWSTFMTEQTRDVIPFPPLTVPPRWAAHAQPRPEQVVALLHQAIEASRKLQPLRVALDNPTPMRLRNLTIADPFESLLEQTKRLECRQKLTGWRDRTIDLTHQARTAMRSCSQAIEQLQRPSVDEPDRMEALKIGKASILRIEKINTQLVERIEYLLSQLWSESNDG